jgi:hypothetical protein
MFIGLFIISKVWDQVRSPSSDKWIKKMWYIYKMKYYSAIKKNEMMPFARKWIEMKIIILCEISQTQKDKYCTRFLRCGI